MQAWEEKYYERQAGKEEGRGEGQTLKLISLVCKKLARNLTVSEIADILEEDECAIQKIADVAIKYAPDYNAEEILNELTGTSSDMDEKSAK